MTINKTYRRLAPNGDETEVTPETYKEVEYYQSFKSDGFRYVPVVVVHRSDDVCVACEG